MFMLQNCRIYVALEGYVFKVLFQTVQGMGQSPGTSKMYIATICIVEVTLDTEVY